MNQSVKPKIIRGKKETDMTSGSIFSHLVNFSIPLLIGNLFQQLYNMVDTWVVGRFVSDSAYAAVGTLGSATNLIIGLFVGLSSGVTVLISQFYGAGRLDRVKDTVHTAMALTLILGIVMTAVGLFINPALLNIYKMPASVIPDAKMYLTIWFSGVIGLMIYNMGAGILRAIGDSRRPFYFLIISAVVNIILDLVFVLAFDMGVAGVAIATVVSQFASAILVIIVLLRSENCVKLSPKNIGFDYPILKRALIIGLPAALQLSVTSFSNVFVQSYINQFGETCMGGWTAYSKIDQLVFLPMQSVSLAVTTFVGQNIGKGQMKRAKRGIGVAISIGVVITAIISIPIIVFAPAFVKFFNVNPEVIEYGTLFLRYLTPFYIFCVFNQVLAGALRGAGNTLAPMVFMLSSFVLFRQIYLYVVSNYVSNTILPISMAYPAGWIVASVITVAYYFIVGFKPKAKKNHISSL